MKIKNTEIELGISMLPVIANLKIEGKNIGKVVLKLIRDFTEFALENDFRRIEIVSLPPFNANVLNTIKTEIKEKFSHFETSYHLPFGEINVVAVHNVVRKTSITETKSLIDLAADLEIKKVVMHPGSYIGFGKSYYLSIASLIKKIAKESILEIHDAAKERGVKLGIENLDFIEPFFKQPEEFKEFAKEGIEIVLDTIHAMRSGINPKKFLKEFKERILEVHLTNGNEGNLSHLPIDVGIVDCPEILNEISKTGGPEIILEQESKKDIKRSIEFLKKEGFLA